MHRLISLWVYVLMWLIIFILPFYSVEEYSIRLHTTSQLAAQLTPNAWIMNTVFLLLGWTSIFDGWRAYRGFQFHKLILVVFGASLIGAALFRHAPIDTSLPYNREIDQWHSLFASITGTAFTALAIATGFIEKRPGRKVLAFGVGTLATVLSLLMVNAPELQGIWQRGIFIGCFGWLVYFYWSFRAARA